MGSCLPEPAVQRKPSFVALPKFARFGSAVRSCASLAPNQPSIVAAYWSTDEVGIQRTWAS